MSPLVPDTRAPGGRASLRLAALGIGLVAAGVLLGVVLASALRPRTGTDDVITGGPPGPRAGPAAGVGALAGQAPAAPGEEAPSPDLEALARRAEAAPADVEAQLTLVRAAADAGRADLALQALDRVLQRQPKHPGALTYLGLITAAQGRADHGLELIDQALAAAPGDPFALWARGGLLFSHRQDYAGAAAAWEAMLRSPKLDAATRSTVEEWVAEARWRAEHGGEVGVAPGGPDTRPGTAAAPSGRAASSAAAISGTVMLGPDVPGGPVQSGALYIIARRGAGPPLAVKRIEAPRFPVAYTLGPEDAMLPGRPVDGDLEIVARLSRSGAAGPAGPGDLEGRFPGNPVRPGTTGVDITLAPVREGSARTD